MKIDPRTIRKVRKTPTGYTAHLGSVYLGTFGNGRLASAAAQGAEALLRHTEEEKKQEGLLTLATFFILIGATLYLPLGNSNLIIEN